MDHQNTCVIALQDTPTQLIIPVSSANIPASYFARDTTILTGGNFAQTAEAVQLKNTKPATALRAFVVLDVITRFPKRRLCMLNAL
jgi:hypothetical protein